jgi:hypothetical protein
MFAGTFPTFLACRRKIGSGKIRMIKTDTVVSSQLLVWIDPRSRRLSQSISDYIQGSLRV